MMDRRRAFILPTVLFVLILLGLLAATFSFHVHADLSSTQVVSDRLQTRLAAEAGIETVKVMLRTARLDVNRWYHNPDEFNRIIVWSPEVEEADWGTNEELEEGAFAYRFSIVADDPTDDEDYIRCGLTDEAARLNLNLATESQLMVLARGLASDDPEFDPQTIVDAILDWRDADDESRGETLITEREYYQGLARPYSIKNGPFDSVEELLLVRGVVGEVLYGEDFDRNGLLSENEDDGDETFPFDNQDRVLSCGLYPYLTVLAYESNVSNDNRQRIDLYGDETLLRTELGLLFEDNPAIVDYIVKVMQAAKAGGGGGGGGDGQGGDGSGGGEEGEGDGSGGGQGAEAEAGGEPLSAEEALDLFEAGRPDKESGKEDKRRQVRGDDDSSGDTRALDGTGDSGEEDTGEEDQAGAGVGEGDGSGDAGDGSGQGEGDGAGGGGDGQEGLQVLSPATFFLDETADAIGEANPLVVEEHLSLLMDRTSAWRSGTLEISLSTGEEGENTLTANVEYQPDQQRIVGLININTAPPMVLRCIPGLTEQQVSAIVETRDEVDSEARATTAWLVTEGVLDLGTYALIAPLITARGQQFEIVSLGFADHMGMVTRLRVVLDMTGPIPQTILCRDESQLGARFPIRAEDEDMIRVR